MTILHGVVGVDKRVPLLDGSMTRYTNLDNAASTPAHTYVSEKVSEFLGWYSSVERGSGFKSRLATELFEDARRIVSEFVGADQPERVVIFVKHTTEGLNMLAERISLQPGDVVLTTVMEHHANILPWQARARRDGVIVDYIAVCDDGSLDEEDVQRKLEKYADRLKVFSVSGASNVTGFVPDIYRYARMVHDLGGEIVIDAAQLVPHRGIDMLAPDDPAHLDYIVFSAHKMYAPFGAGAVVGPRETFQHGLPDLTGGGAVEYVTLEETLWKEPPEKEEAGSPNSVGGIALGAACVALRDYGLEYLKTHEAELTTYLLEQLREIPGLTVLGSADPTRTEDRLGVVSFAVHGLDHALVAAVLSYEYGIGVRNGSFCAHPYVQRLLKVAGADAERIRHALRAGDRRRVPGAIRASLGFYNTRENVEKLVSALTRITSGEYEPVYRQDRATGEYHPENWVADYHHYFRLR